MAGPRAVIAIATILLGATLAGCSEDDPLPRVEPSSPGSPSAATSLSPSPDPSPRPMSPEETVRAWVKAQNQAMATGRTTTIESLSTADCRTCDQFIDPVVAVYRAGGRFKTKGWVVRGTNQRRPNGPNRVVDAALRFSGGTTVRRKGEDPVAYGPENHLMVFRLRPHGEGWRVSFAGFLS